jgi:hypothetical protein
LNPGCKLYGKSLSKQDIENRLQQNGDLCNSYFRFVFPRPENISLLGDGLPTLEHTS